MSRALGIERKGIGNCVGGRDLNDKGRKMFDQEKHVWSCRYKDD